MTFLNSNLRNKFVNSILIKGASSALVFRIVSMGLGLLTSVFLGRILGAGEYGAYVYVLSILNLLSIPATFGLPELVVRNIVIYQANEQWNLFRGLFIRANQVVICSSLLIIGIILLVFNVYDFSKLPIQLETFWVGLAILPFLGLSALRNACLRGLRLIFLSQISESLVQPLLFLVVFFSLYFYQLIELNALVTMQTRAISIFITFFFGSYLLLRNIPKNIGSIKAGYETSRWGRSALSFMFIGGIMFINNQIDIVMLGLYKSSSEVGIYKIVTVGASLVVFGLSAVNLALSPTVAKYYAKKERKELQKILTFSARLSFLATLPVALIFILAGDVLLGWVYGTEYAQGAKALVILTCAQVINCIFGSVALLLSMTGNERYVLKGQAVAAILNVILNYLLIPELGMEGAALATSISLVIWNILLFGVVYKRLRLNTTALKWAKV